MRHNIAKAERILSSETAKKARLAESNNKDKTPLPDGNCRQNRKLRHGGKQLKIGVFCTELIIDGLGRKSGRASSVATRHILRRM
jgi:hypothetical protein